MAIHAQATRQHLHSLVDIVDDTGLETLFNVMIRFVAEDYPLPDEIASHSTAAYEYKRGEIFLDKDINWD